VTKKTIEVGKQTTVHTKKIEKTLSIVKQVAKKAKNSEESENDNETDFSEEMEVEDATQERDLAILDQILSKETHEEDLPSDIELEEEVHENKKKKVVTKLSEENRKRWISLM
jgi:hypothetical protein